MALEAGLVLQNTVDTIEAMTGRTEWQRTTTFTHAATVFTIEELASSRGFTRTFVVRPTGEHRSTGPAGQGMSPRDVILGLDIEIGYRAGKDALAAYKVMLDDADAVKHALRLPENYDQANTNMSLRDSSDFDIDLEGTEGDAAVLRIPVECRYRPEFT